MHDETTCPFCAAGHLATPIKNKWKVQILDWAPEEFNITEPELGPSFFPEAPEYMFDEFLKLTEAVIKQDGKKTIHAEANIFNTDVMFMYPDATRIYIKDMPEPKSHWHKVEKKMNLSKIV